MPTMLFYEQPTVLDRGAHKALKIKASGPDFRFAKNTNCIPVAGVEFPIAALEYPIVFAGPSLQELAPVVVVGLRNEECLLVEEDGKWAGMYIPAFIRRYPFVLAGEPGESNFAVCVDMAFKGMNETEGEALFDAEGKETPLLNNVVQFLREYQDHMMRTQSLVNKLRELELLQAQTLQGTDPSGKPFALQGFWSVDEKKLNELSAEQVGELFRQGFLGLIYAHLLSLGNVRRLVTKMK
jgi:hypothetical protein